MKRVMSYLQYISTYIHIHQTLYFNVIVELLRMGVYEFILINLVLVTFKHYMCLKRLVKSSNNLIVFHIATTQHSDYTCRTTRHSILIINKNSLTLLTPC